MLASPVQTDHRLLHRLVKQVFEVRYELIYKFDGEHNSTPGSSESWENFGIFPIVFAARGAVAADRAHLAPLFHRGIGASNVSYHSLLRPISLPVNQ